MGVKLGETVPGTSQSDRQNSAFGMLSGAQSEQIYSEMLRETVE
jgi:hypothetical protein